MSDHRGDHNNVHNDSNDHIQNDIIAYTHKIRLNEVGSDDLKELFEMKEDLNISEYELSTMIENQGTYVFIYFYFLYDVMQLYELVDIVLLHISAGKYCNCLKSVLDEMDRNL